MDNRVLERLANTAVSREIRIPGTKDGQIAWQVHRGRQRIHFTGWRLRGN